ncbi:MAG: YybH family protein [Acidimicrobiales bacterium]
MASDVSEEVLAAASQLVAAFGTFDRDAYFAAFRSDADFIFYNSTTTFHDRASYEEAWDDWASEGWRVLSCESIGGAVRVLDDDHAIFTHEVSTTLGPSDSPTVLHERETIVFSRDAGRWLATHEHLSSVPII